jgi:exonuclease III
VCLRHLLAQCGDVELNPGPNHNINVNNNININDELVTRPVITIMTQNCRGLNDYNKMRLIIKNKNSMVNKTKMILALQETHLINDDWIKWSGNYVISKAPSPHSAGCITYFNEDVHIVEVQHIDEQGHGHVAVIEGLLPNTVIFANIYSPVRSLARDQENFFKKLLDIIEELELKYIFNEPNLIIAGDFNIPLDKDRNVFSSDSEFERAMSLSQQLETKGLIDSWKEDDYRFTFKMSYSRLDRILFRLSATYKEKLETDWTFTNSDHCLVKLLLNETRTRSNNDRVVSLPTYLLDNEEATVMIRDKMTELVNQCEPHWDAKLRLEYLKMCLRTTVGEVAKLLKRRERAELEEIQKGITWRIGLMQSLPLHAIDLNKQQLDNLFTRRNLILDAKCKKLAEKAKTRWFFEGEKASKYFLNLLNKRRGQQVIEKLITDRGEITEGAEIDEEINNFYKELYERGDNIINHTDGLFYENVTKVNAEIAERVTLPLSKDEIYETLLTCKDSAPGPDGIPYSYYKQYWSLFGDTLAQSWSEALQTGTLPESHNNSILRLLPKIGKDTNKLTNWRPITLSNCDHKLITKCLAKRLTSTLGSYLHPNQTAYLPGKQIQDNLRVLNITNEMSPDTLIISLDARKAFDTVSHSYIRNTLVAYGLENFIPVFNLLYEKQRVSIHVNGRKLDGYNIKNGVKQGDSLSCILFIMCMDPLIRNIEANPSISRPEIQAIPLPKVLAYADDITCIVERDTRNVKMIFNEYGRLTRASGLTLNADKTEILDIREQLHKVKYQGRVYRLRGAKSVKINGVVFDKDIDLMKLENFNHLVNKIEKMLNGWRARQLSLLGKILIYKTFGLSQVIYILSIISLSVAQHKKLRIIFNNFLWGRDLADPSTRARISRERLNTPIEYGGFGMVEYERILEGVYCKQLAKMYNTNFNHPLKFIIMINDRNFATGNSLTGLADEVARKAHVLLNDLFWKDVKKLSNQQIINDAVLLSHFGELFIEEAIKPRWNNTAEANMLLHTLGCNNVRDILDRGREAVKLCKKVMTAKYLRVVKALWQAQSRCEVPMVDKIKILNGSYKILYTVKSGEFRELIRGPPRLTPPRLALNINIGDNEGRWAVKGYFSKVRKLANTRHKNTLLRLWNGDCLSYTRLVHYGVVNSELCPNCANVDTPLHMLVECHVAVQTWNMLMVKIPKHRDMSMLDYIIGLYDSKIDMSIKAEIIKMLMHFRDMSPDAILRRLSNYFMTVNGRNAYIRQLME